MTDAGLPWPGNDSGKRRALLSFYGSAKLGKCHVERLGDLTDRHPCRRRLAKLDTGIAPRRDPALIGESFLRQLALRAQTP
jgi:hypothetical protein